MYSNQHFQKRQIIIYLISSLRLSSYTAKMRISAKDIKNPKFASKKRKPQRQPVFVNSTCSPPCISSGNYQN